MPASRGRFQRKGRILYVTRDAELLRKQLGGEDLTLEGRGASRRQHLDRRAHARVGLLLLRRDARSLLPRRAARRRRSRRTRSRTAASRSSSAAPRRAAARRARPRRTASSRAGSASSSRRASRRSTAQNAQNIGLLTSTDFALLERIERGEEIPIERVHPRARPDQRGDRRARRALRLQPRAHGGAGLAADDHHRGAADDPLREDHRGATRWSTPSAEPARRPGGSAGRRALRAHRRALLARVRDADGRAALSRGVRARRQGHRSGERLRVPRSPHVPRPGDAQGARRASGLREQAASLATVQEAFTKRQGIRLYGEVTRDGTLRRLRGHLPQQGHRGDRAPGAGRGRVPTRTPAWRARSGASRSASARPTWPTPGSRATCASQVPESVALRAHRATRAGRLREGRDAPPPRAALLAKRRGDRQGARVRRRRDLALAARRARHAHQHGGRSRRLHRDHRGRRGGRRLPRCAARARATRFASASW